MAALKALHLEILADARLRPAALCWQPAGVDAGALAALVATEAFRALAGRIAVLVEERHAVALPPALTDALLAAGCRLVGDHAIRRADALDEPPMAEALIHLGGTWYWQAPRKPAGAGSASRALALQLLQLIAVDADTREIEAILRRDPAMSYHLLRLVNSLQMGGRQVTSFAQAIMILGRRQLQRWLNLMLFAARADDPRAPMLMARVAVRARGMELLARVAGFDKATQESAFMVGMFSLLGVLFGMPLVEVLQPLKLDAATSAALLREQGPLGRLLAVLLAMERGDTLAPGIDPVLAIDGDFDCAALQIEAHDWMLDAIGVGRGGADE